MCSATALPRVLIADAQPLLAEALGRALEVDHGVEVVHRYPDRGGAAMEAIGRHRPEVVVYDFWLFGLDGAAATREILSSVPGTKVLVTSWYHGAPHIQAALSAGASGFLPKSLRVSQVAEAVHRAAAGEDLVFAEQLAGLVDGLDARWQIAREGGERLSSLTRREIKVLEVLSGGVSHAQAAEELSISQGTLKNHLHHIMAKTAAVSQVQAVSAAREAGLLAEGPRRSPTPPERGSPVPAAAPPAHAPIGPVEQTSVLVADTQFLFADALATSLSGDPGLRVMPAGPTRAGEAIEAVVRLRPHVVVYDLHLRDMEPWAAVRTLARWAPDTKVVLVSWYQGPPRVRQALAAGPDVVVPKTASLQSLTEAVLRAGRRDIEGHTSQITEVVDLLDHHKVSETDLELLLSLTPREVQLLQLLARGRPIKEMAASLCLAVGTVKNVIHTLLSKLRVRSQPEALAMARAAGFVM